jgi:hypothetical protein
LIPLAQLSTLKPIAITPRAKPDIIASVTGGREKSSAFHFSYSSATTGAENQTSRPAQFGYSTQKAGKANFTVDAAISYTRDLGMYKGATFKIIPNFEAHTSNVVPNQQDSIAANLPLTMIVPVSSSNPNHQSVFAAHAFSLSGSFLTDSKNTVETAQSGLLYTPVLNYLPGLEHFPFNTQSVIPLINRTNEFGEPLSPWLGYQLLPSIGLEGGRAVKFDKSSVYNNNPDYVRFVFNLHGVLSVAQWFALAADFTERKDLYGGSKNYDFVSLSPIFYPAAFFTTDINYDPTKIQAFSIGMTFKYGKTTPLFNNVNSISAWIGLQF